MPPRRLFALVAALLVGCAARGGSAPSTRAEPTGRVVGFAPAVGCCANPERGFYRFVDPAGPQPPAGGGERLAFMLFRLDAHRDAELSPATVASVARALGAAREAGVKVIVRFAYNAGPFPGPAQDAPLPRVLAHVAQLRGVLREEADVVAVVQAGFFGAWGEWHSSARGNDVLAPRRALALALLDALPGSRSIQLRFPVDKARLFGDDTSGGAGRVGHHNDCFLASDDDEGTWPAAARARWQAMVAADGLHAPIGGETCRPNPPRTGCQSALAELARYRYSFLNRDWHPEVLAAWRREGCLDTIEARLGYRLVLERAWLPRSLAAGRRAAVSVRLRNDGWAPPYNPRPVELALTCADRTLRLPLPAVDWRRWTPGTPVTLEAPLPSTAEHLRAARRCAVALCMPDASPRLRGRAAYAVRFANEGTWDAAAGCNRLGEVPVAESAESEAGDVGGAGRGGR